MHRFKIIAQTVIYNAEEATPVTHAYICDAIRTPIGRFAGSLSSVRADDLAAVPIRSLLERNSTVDWEALDDVFYGCANQAGEDNRNVGRMAALLAGLPASVPATTINRLCGSSLDAVAQAARAIRSGECELAIAGGVESMTRAPFVMGKADAAFSRAAKLENTTIGWRFVNPIMKQRYGVDSMPETAENVATDFRISREDQDAFALRSQQRYARARTARHPRQEITPVDITLKKGESRKVEDDEHPRADTTLDALRRLTPIVRPEDQGSSLRDLTRLAAVHWNRACVETPNVGRQLPATTPLRPTARGFVARIHAPHCALTAAAVTNVKIRQLSDFLTPVSAND